MKQELIKQENYCDRQGNPAGGFYNAEGLAIFWQNGPLGQGDERKEPNGAFVETVIEAARRRLEYFQTSRFQCEENARAIKALEKALEALESRTAKREMAGIEGAHEVKPTPAPEPETDLDLPFAQ